MFGGVRKAFFLIVSMSCTLPAMAQFIDDIPLFDETPTPSASVQPDKQQVSTSLAISPNIEQSEKEYNSRQIYRVVDGTGRVLDAWTI